MSTEFLDVGEVRIAFEINGSGPPLVSKKHRWHGSSASAVRPCINT